MTDEGTKIDTYYRVTNFGDQFLDFMMKPPVADNAKESDD